MYGYIYKTTNIINNKVYIGQHKSKIFEPTKYIGSGVMLNYAIDKYGIENFKNELLCECLTQEELDDKEQYYIKLFDATNRNIGYNIQTGGNSNPITTENYVWVTNDKEDHLINTYFLNEFLEKGYHFGRSHLQTSWCTGKTKESDKTLQQISETRKTKIAAGEIRCCYGLKGAESPNYKTDEYLKQNYLDNGFVDYLFTNGKCNTLKYFHLKMSTFDRLVALAGLISKKVGHAYIFTYIEQSN